MDVWFFFWLILKTFKHSWCWEKYVNPSANGTNES